MFQKEFKSAPVTHRIQYFAVDSGQMCGFWALILKAGLTQERLAAYQSIQPRGPDSSCLHMTKSCVHGFHRLAINDLSEKGQQPFMKVEGDIRLVVMCVGEIYNHEQIRKDYGLVIDSHSDCAVVLPLFQKLGEDFRALNTILHGQYTAYITKENLKTGDVEYWLSTDPLSVKPVFYYSSQNQFGMSSHLSGVAPLSKQVQRLNQGHYLRGKYTYGSDKNEILQVTKYTEKPKVQFEEENEELYRRIVGELTTAVERRLMSDRQIGCLLSGGLDSSLVAAIAANLLAKEGKQLRTFSIGMKEGTDIVYARQVASHINSLHTEFIYTPEEALAAIPHVLSVTETFDITTIRASVGQHLLAKRIASSTDVKVVLNGDGADQCQMGYLYFYLAPNAEEAGKERDKLVQEIHLYDGLRVDRTIASQGMEPRVPFLDQDFVNLYYKISPQLLIPTPARMEKFLIRKAFEVVMPNLLPAPVLWRKKEAFSDGVSSKEKSWYVMVREQVGGRLLPEELERRKRARGDSEKLLGSEKTVQSPTHPKEDVSQSQSQKNQVQVKQFPESSTTPVKHKESTLAPITTIPTEITFEGLQPVCPQSFYYRLLHSQLFNSNHGMLSHYWLPSWIKTNEPSARILHVYENTAEGSVK